MKKLLLLIPLAVLLMAATRSPQDSLKIIGGVATPEAMFVQLGGSTLSTTTWRQLKSSTSYDASMIEVNNSQANPIYFASCAAGSECIKFIIFPSTTTRAQIDLPAGSRIAILAASTGVSITSGTLLFNFFGQ